MAEWFVKLEGGPADGDEGMVDRLPANIWAAFCNGCGEWHWDSRRRKGYERYAKQTVDEGAKVAKYVYNDLDLDGLDQLDREAERELVGAGPRVH